MIQLTWVLFIFYRFIQCFVSCSAKVLIECAIHWHDITDIDKVEKKDLVFTQSRIRVRHTVASWWDYIHKKSKLYSRKFVRIITFTFRHTSHSHLNAHSVCNSHSVVIDNEMDFLYALNEKVTLISSVTIVGSFLYKINVCPPLPAEIHN